jgi:hypothetical protein
MKWFLILVAAIYSSHLARAIVPVMDTSATMRIRAKLLNNTVELAFGDTGLVSVELYSDTVTIAGLTVSYHISA